MNKPNITLVKKEDEVFVHPMTEMTMRADVDGNILKRVVLPAPVQINSAQATAIACWAKPISSTCIIDTEIYVNDIKPSCAHMTVSDLEQDLAKKVMPLIHAAMLRGFGLRLMRENASDPYEISIVRKVIDVPQLSIPWRSMNIFLQALEITCWESPSGTINLESFSRLLSRRTMECIDAGVGHYHQYAGRIVDYGRANNAKVILWGPERRGSFED